MSQQCCHITRHLALQRISDGSWSQKLLDSLICRQFAPSIKHNNTVWSFSSPAGILVFTLHRSNVFLACSSHATENLFVFSSSVQRSAPQLYNSIPRYPLAESSHSNAVSDRGSVDAFDAGDRARLSKGLVRLRSSNSRSFCLTRQTGLCCCCCTLGSCCPRIAE